MDNLKDTDKNSNPKPKIVKQIGADLADVYHLNAPLVHMQFDLKDYENR